MPELEAMPPIAGMQANGEPADSAASRIRSDAVPDPGGGTIEYAVYVELVHDDEDDPRENGDEDRVFGRRCAIR